LEDALPPEDGIADGPLYQGALAVEQDQALMAEMAEWEVATLETGCAMMAMFGPNPPPITIVAEVQTDDSPLVVAGPGPWAFSPRT